MLSDECMKRVETATVIFDTNITLVETTVFHVHPSLPYNFQHDWDKDRQRRKHRTSADCLSLSQSRCKLWWTLTNSPNCPFPFHSEQTIKWDRVIRKLCSGCWGKLTLHNYDSFSNWITWENVDSKYNFGELVPLYINDAGLEKV